MSEWREQSGYAVWAENEALEWFPENYHMGKWDGIIPRDEVEARMALQRRAFEWGAQALWEKMNGVKA